MGRWLLVLLVVAVAVAIWAWRFGGSSGERVERANGVAPDSRVATLESPRVIAEREGAAVEQSSAPSVTARSTTNIRVLNGAGAPIESAVVWRLREAEFRRLGTTDALGVFVVDSNEITGCELLASHPRYQPTRQVVDDSGKAITLVLRAGATIRGSIVRAGGLPCAGVRVAGWVDGFEPECLALRDLHRDDPRCAQTVSDEAGRFELVGLDRARRYSVVAAGSGWVAERGAHRIAPDGEELTIQVAALYGVRVQFRDEDGALPRTAPEIWSSSGTAFDLLDERALQTVELSAARLLGLDFPCAEVERDDIALFYTRDDDAATVGPLVVRHRIPGYAPAMTRLDVPRVTGELATHVVRVRRDALDVGRLVVEFTGALAAEPELGNVVALGNYLELEGARGDKLRVRVAHASGSRALDGLPYGPYRARFFGADGLWRFPPDRGATVLEIGATPANFVVDWGDAAACIVRAFADDGAELDGPATLRVRSTTNRGIHQFEAARAPYVLVGLAPDEYDVAWLRPHEGAKYGQEAHRARLALTAGRVAEVRLDETR